LHTQQHNSQFPLHHPDQPASSRAAAAAAAAMTAWVADRHRRFARLLAACVCHRLISQQLSQRRLLAIIFSI